MSSGARDRLGQLWAADPLRARRRPTRIVRVGDVSIGGREPIRIQSMTTADTLDTRATVAQIERLAEAGCEIARVTAPSIRDAENLAAIASELRRRGVRIPLVADIHFTPNAALVAADHVEKVRINPGNYADKKKFEVREYSDAAYREELERVAERFRPLVRKCRENGVAMRIGTNHGSLSDRIMNRHGDTPEGMVESALEFLDVCEDEGYRDVVFSMKASNPQVAIHAYRLLAARLADRSSGEPGYPFHVGVTEAGAGEDGRVKSAIGIGSLLEDGLGDTIRVSLTEDPVAEVPVARALARRAEARWAQDAVHPAREAEAIAQSHVFVRDPFSHERRATRALSLGGLALGGEEPVRVEHELALHPGTAAAEAARVGTALALLEDIACESLAARARTSVELAEWPALRRELDAVGCGLPVALRVPLSLADAALVLAPAPARLALELGPTPDREALAAIAAAAAERSLALEWCVTGDPVTVAEQVAAALAASRTGRLSQAVFSSDSPRACHASRALVGALAERGAADLPIVLRSTAEPGAALEAQSLDAAIDLGAALCDGLGDAVSLSGISDLARSVDLAYRILQGARLRTTRTEYISCPSCGRTLFDLETITAHIQRKTAHLKGVKIAVMGCIVNGPGEMADADFGYVGSGPGTVSLYVGKQVVERHVPESEAADRLVELIQKHGRWREG